MSTHIIRYEVKPDQADENERLVAAVFAQLTEEKPEGLHYATFRMEDGVSFVHIVSYDDDDADLLRPLAAFKAFQADAADRMVGSTQRGTATVVGSYGFFGG
jgi:hypothetical protein